MDESTVLPVVTTDSFLANVSRILDAGSANSTLKWALLAGFVEAAPLLAGQDTIDLGLVADAVIRLYRRQVQPYPLLGTTLHQAGGGQRQLSLLGDAEGLKRGGATVRKKVAWLLAQWPSPRLQFVNGEMVPLLFCVETAWTEHLRSKGSNKKVPQRMFQRSADGLPVLAALPGSIDCLLRVGPLLRDAIEFRWTTQVAQINKLVAKDQEQSLHGFLFPRTARSEFSAKFRSALCELNDGRCFWCGAPIAAKGAEVDHVVPWSVSRNEAVENLVVAHRECNRTKSDHLPHPELSLRWLEYINSNRELLRQLAAKHSMESGADLSVAWMRGRYAIAASQESCSVFCLADGTPVIEQVEPSVAAEFLKLLC